MREIRIQSAKILSGMDANISRKSLWEEWMRGCNSRFYFYSRLISFVGALSETRNTHQSELACKHTELRISRTLSKSMNRKKRKKKQTMLTSILSATRRETEQTMSVQAMRNERKETIRNENNRNKCQRKRINCCWRPIQNHLSINYLFKCLFNNNVIIISESNLDVLFLSLRCWLFS